MTKSILFSIIAMTLFGIGFASFDVAATLEWYENTILFQFSGLVVAILVSLLWTRGNTWRETRKVARSKISYFGALAGGIGTIGLFLAFENT